MAAADPTLAPGSLVGGRYRVTGVLASGGMGAVHEAIDERLDRAVAVKVIRPELVQDPTLVARFEREARAAARLSHPGIVQVFDFGRTDDGLGFLVMERVQGDTVGALLTRERRLPPRRAADLVEQALGALACAHAAGIVHRDLKPGNLMVVPIGASREAVEVLDFGIARLAESDAYTRLTHTGVILGTPAYMAPEQAEGRAIDARTDVYAMGVILWCMLTGQKPFPGSDMAAVVEALLTKTPPRADAIVPGTPPELASIADVAMRKDPGARFASADAMARALVELREREAPRAQSVAPAPSPSQAIERAPTTRGPEPRPNTMLGPGSSGATAASPSTLLGSPPMTSALAPAGEPTHLLGGGAPRDAPVRRAIAYFRDRPSRLLILATLALVSACGLGGLVSVPAYLYVVSGGTPWGTTAPPTLVNVPSGPSPTAPTPVQRPVPASTGTAQDVVAACARTARCCEVFSSHFGSSAGACAMFRDHPEYIQTPCDELTANYRTGLAAVGADTSACDP